MTQFKFVHMEPVINFTDWEEDLPAQFNDYAEEMTKKTKDGWVFIGLYPFKLNMVETGSFLGKMVKNKFAGRSFFDDQKLSFTTNMMLFKRDLTEEEYVALKEREKTEKAEKEKLEQDKKNVKVLEKSKLHYVYLDTSDVVAHLNIGDIVEIIKYKPPGGTPWVNVKFNDKEGWVQEKYLEIKK